MLTDREMDQVHALLTQTAKGVTELAHLFPLVGGVMLDRIEEWAIHDWRQAQAKLALLAARADEETRGRISLCLTLALACGTCAYVHSHVGYFARALDRALRRLRRPVAHTLH